MASQKDVKNRIASIKNINKITRAMEMVAAARLRRAEERIAQLRPYAQGMRKLTRRAAEQAGGVPLSESRPSALRSNAAISSAASRPISRGCGLIVFIQHFVGNVQEQIFHGGAGLRAGAEARPALACKLIDICIADLPFGGEVRLVESQHERHWAELLRALFLDRNGLLQGGLAAAIRY